MALPVALRSAVGTHTPRAIKDLADSIGNRPTRAYRKRVSSTQKFQVDFDRVYFYHIRKCAGTSLVTGLLGADGRDGPAGYRQLATSKHGWTEIDGRIFVGWHTGLINEGFYHFGFSHSASHEIKLPPRTFTVTSLRDPVKRVLSHYRMLRYFQALRPAEYAMRFEGPWLGDHFSDFLERIPREHLLRQLYVFSPSFDVSEAADRINGLNRVLFVEALGDGIADLSQTLGVDISPHREKRYDYDVEVSEAEQARLRELLAPEYRLMELIDHRRGS